MAEFLGNMYSWFSFIPRITFTNLVEILILTVLIYEVFLWVQNTRTGVLLKGGLVIIAFYLLAALFHLNTIIWIANNLGQILLLAVIVIFQPELRKALEQLGSKNIFMDFFTTENKRIQEGYTDKTVNEIVRAAYEMGKVKTGALIVIERETPLQEIERTGIMVDGIVTSQLLINIFEHNTPLHDGAVVVRGNRVTAATCYLPLSDNLSISKDLGTRHRAALGISESTDSLTVVVSEETGRVTLAEHGTLRRITDPEELKKALAVESKEEAAGGRFRLWKGRHKNERKAE
ncbi:MAG TPA: TIGR00159 family protein [Candidatus Copromonas avistercoris]|nr:TIGR00159 family protein [Candidatus Copromonas avistercoris]